MTRPPPELPLEERVMTCAEYVEFKGLEKGVSLPQAKPSLPAISTPGQR